MIMRIELPDGRRAFVSDYRRSFKVNAGVTKVELKDGVIADKLEFYTTEEVLLWSYPKYIDLYSNGKIQYVEIREALSLSDA